MLRAFKSGTTCYDLREKYAEIVMELIGESESCTEDEGSGPVFHGLQSKRNDMIM